MSKSEYKPDCGYAWVVVAGCFTINFIMTGLLRGAGVLYVALIDVYGVSREVASMPFTLRFCLRNLAGPLVGALGQRFGIRPVVASGGLICGLGGIVSAFAPDVTWITIAWGGIHGLGYGMCNIIHVIAITRYFHKYRGFALGLCYTGDCFGTFLLPLLLDFLLETYDIKGTFLILAGISLNVVPAAMLLKSPPWEKSDMISANNHEMKHINMNNDVKKQGINNEGFDITPEEYVSDSEIKFLRNSVPVITINEQVHSPKLYERHHPLPSCDKKFELRTSKQPYMPFNDFYSNMKYKRHRLSDAFMLNEIYTLRESSSLRVTDKNMKKKRWSCHLNAYDTDRKCSQISDTSVISCPSQLEKNVAETQSIKQLRHPSNVGLPSAIENGSLSAETAYCCDQSSRRDSNVNEACALKHSSHLHNEKSQRNTTGKPIPLYEEEVLTALDYACEDINTKVKRNEISTRGSQQPNAFLQFIRTNVKPMFLIICATMALFVFLLISIFTIIIDYAADNGIPSEYGNYLIISFSLTDVFGRLGFGVVLDKKWLSISYYAGLTTGIMGLCIFIIPLFKCFPFWIMSIGLCGFVQGGTAVMFPFLVEHYMEKNEESIAMGCLNFYGGLLMLPIPPMIGFFRDNMGSYDGVFWMVGALCMFAGSLWIFEPCIVRRKEEEMRRKTEALCSEVRKI